MPAMVGAVVLGWVAAVSAAAPSAHAATAADVAVIGDQITSTRLSSSSATYPEGPVAGVPAARVDPASSTVTVSVQDPVNGGSATMTMAWPARTGSWALDFRGPDAEQTVKLTRGTRSCTFTSGTLQVYLAETTATGDVAALSVDATGSCGLSGSGLYAGAQVRIGDNDPTRVVSVPRATPASVSTGAVNGTVVTRDVTVTNTGDRPWTVRSAVVASASSPSKFTVTPDGNHCTGLTLTTGQTCTVQVTVTASFYTVWEDLVVGGDSPMTLAVPLTLEGYNPVEPPSALAATPGRLSATVSWQPPSKLPVVGYRVYDVTAGSRTLLASAPASATQVLVPGAGPRTLALVAANGRYAESPDVVVDVPAVTSEVVASDPYGSTVSFATDPASPAERALTLERVDLDASRTLWVSSGGVGVRVCPVATEQCVTVPGTDGTANPDVDSPTEARWLPDGSIAFLRGNSDQLRTLWVVRSDGTGLRKVANVPNHDQLAPAPDGTQVVLRNNDGFGRFERVRLSDGSITAIPGTDGADNFTVSTRGQLVVERRVDTASTTGPRTATVMNLDGSGARRLALPIGDNRAVTFDPTGTLVAFARYTGDFEATIWVAAADGTAARQLSTSTGWWLGLRWSVDDRMSPTAGIAVPAYTTRSAALTIGAADGDDPVGSLRRECRLDSATTWSPCGPTLSLTGLTVGTHSVSARVTDPGGRQSGVVSKSWVVDASAPTAAMTAPASVQTRTPVTLTWTATDAGGSGVASYDVRSRYASSSTGFGAYGYPSAWQKLTATSLNATLGAGNQYCFSVRARDRAGNTGAWSAERCTSMPLDDRALSASTGWTRGSSTSYLFNTYSKTVKTGAQLTRSGVQARRLAVVATTCSTCGSVDVYHAGGKLGRLSLYSSTTRTRQVLWLPVQTVTRTGTVTIRSLSTKQVLIDGLAITH
ncbi:TolB family protein [Intrasporangium flavum]|uniref:TolB family protein n=1 Tax=Intrasporangium flavum TaxID=1428657 RepID=UPI001A9794EF|nr:hypothetical protein [Intrasporangium flavum]